MTMRTFAPPLDYQPAPRVVNQTPCRTGLFLFLILLGTAVLTVDRYLTNDAVRRAEDIETWSTRELAEIKAADDAQIRVMVAVRANEILARQLSLVQERLDNLSIEGIKLLQENLELRVLLGPTTGPVLEPKADKET